MKVRVESVIVGERYRKSLGDLTDLARSMREVGLLHPIVVTGPDNVLIAGGRRLQAARDLGWSSIEARRIDLDDPLRAERDENEQRKPLTKSEAVAIARAIKEREAEKAKERQGRPGLPRSEESPEHEETGRAADKAAAAVGMSRPTLAKATEVVEAAEADPAHADLVEQMDETGKVEPAHRALAERRAAAGIPNDPIPDDPLAERHCPKCGRDTPAWVLDGKPQPEGAKTYRWLSRIRGRRK